MNRLILIFILGFAGFCTSVVAQTDTLSFSAPEKLSKQVNSYAEESFPVFSADGKTMYFARTMHLANKGGKYNGQDIWTSKIDGDEFGLAQNLTELNSKGSDVVIGASADGNTLYLLHQKDMEGNVQPGISKSEYNSTEGKWGKPQPVVIPNLVVESTFYSAFVSPAEDFILWSIPVPGDSINNDLFVSTSADAGSNWTTPITLGMNINSTNDEISPFFDPVTNLLFFSVNKPGDYLDYDIYYARRLGDTWTEWTEPVNAGNNLNSSAFDAYFYTQPNGTAYFSSNRNDTLANLYLSELVISKTEIETEIDSTEAIAEEVLSELPENLTQEPEMPDPVLVIETTKDGKRTDRLLSSLSKDELLDEETRIRFVYFDYDNYNISAKYIEVLDDAARILDDYPNMTLRIVGHTDAIASDAYNQVLSENRAASAKEFLVINGVIPDRISTSGKGEKEPYANNLTAEGRALNRRVEMFFEEK